MYSNTYYDENNEGKDLVEKSCLAVVVIMCVVAFFVCLVATILLILSNSGVVDLRSESDQQLMTKALNARIASVNANLDQYGGYTTSKLGQKGNTTNFATTFGVTENPEEVWCYQITVNPSQTALANGFEQTISYYIVYKESNGKWFANNVLFEHILPLGCYFD